MLRFLLPAVVLCGGSASWTFIAALLSVRLILALPNCNALLLPLRAVRQLLSLASAATARVGAVAAALWKAGDAALEKYPLAADMCSSLVAWSLFCALALVSLAPKETPEMKSLASLLAFVFFASGPSHHYFYRYLDSKIVGTTAAAVAAKVAVDQLLWLPVFTSVLMTYLMMVMGGESVGGVGATLRNELFATCRGTWTCGFPVVQAFSFRFVSSRHRVVFINGVLIAIIAVLGLIIGVDV